MVHSIVFIPVLLALHSSPELQTYAQLTMLLAEGLQNLEAELLTDLFSPYSTRDTGKPAIFQEFFCSEILILRQILFLNH